MKLCTPLTIITASGLLNFSTPLLQACMYKKNVSTKECFLHCLVRISVVFHVMATLRQRTIWCLPASLIQRILSLYCSFTTSATVGNRNKNHLIAIQYIWMASHFRIQKRLTFLLFTLLAFRAVHFSHIFVMAG